MRVLLADDQQNVRYALHVLLDRRPELEMVGDVSDAYELLSFITEFVPDVVILDWMLPGLADVGSVATLKAINPNIKIISLSSRPELGDDALRAGADDFISKIDPPEKLLGAIARLDVQLDVLPTGDRQN